MGLVKRLRDGIVNPDVLASTVLREAKILASDLGHGELSQWLVNELNGYTKDADLPDYRRIHSPLLGKFSGPWGSMISDYSIPVSLLPDIMRDNADQLPMSQALREVEALARNTTRHVHVWPAEGVILARDTIRLSGGYALVELYQPLSHANLEGVIDAVRNRFLDFLLGLQGINAEILESEKAIATLPKEKVMHVFNVTVQGNGNVIAPQSHIAQISVESIHHNDFESLRQFLVGIGIDSDDLEGLKNALGEDGDREKGEVGGRVQDWIKNMLGKAVSGVWKAGLSVSTAVLQEAIFRFYGWK